MPDRVHTDTCARCGADKGEARKLDRNLAFRCFAWGSRYVYHRWGGEPEEEADA